MRLTVLAVGYSRGTSEGTLADDYIHRAGLMGRNMGFAAVTVEEVSVSKARDAKTRMADEAEKLSDRVPAGAHIVLLDAKGKTVAQVPTPALPAPKDLKPHTATVTLTLPANFHTAGASVAIVSPQQEITLLNNQVPLPAK